MKKNRYVIFIATLFVAFSGVFVSCNDEDDESANVTLNTDLVSLVIGTSETLTATVTPSSAGLTWISGNPEVATVENGVVRAVGVGQTVVNAKAGNCIAVCDVIVTVVPVPVQGVTLKKEEIILATGDKETAAYELIPAEATSRKVRWSSSNPGVATIHFSLGEIVAVSLGETVITATTLDGAKTASCKVYVVPIIALKEPAHNTTRALNLLNLDEQITFAWDTYPEVPSYMVKFSTLSNFEGIFFTTETTVGSIAVSSYDLNNAIKERPTGAAPVYWTVTPSSSDVRMITKTSTLNLTPDRHDYLPLVASSASGMQVTPQEKPYHFLLSTSGASSVRTAGLTKALSGDSIVLSFNYKSSAAVTSPTVSLYKSNGTLAEGPIEVQEIANVNAWTNWGTLIEFTQYDWGAAGDYLELSFGDESAQIEINGIHFRGISQKEYVPQILGITSVSGHTVLTRVSETEFILETTGTDPNFTTSRLQRPLPAGAVILCFEYKSEKTMANNLQIFFAPPLAEGNSVRLGTVPPADDWKRYEYDASNVRQQFLWGLQGGSAGDFMRIDIGEQVGYTMHIRNIHFEYKK